MTKLIHVPADALKWPELAKAVEERDRLLARHRDANAKLEALQVRAAEAEKADRQALAAALATGKKDPGTSAVEAVAAEIAAAKRELEALDLAVADAQNRIVDLVETRRDEWGADQQTHETDAARTYADAVTLLEQARANLEAARSLGVWMRDVTGSKQARSGYVSRVPFAGVVFGGELTFEQVVGALRQDVEKQQPKMLELAA
ncbi:MAG TPA: hypothetical protein VNI55_13055 [Gaiellaceae bacterium]|nr:hypothetical protein [Gaiellaceae bacterium]